MRPRPKVTGNNNNNDSPSVTNAPDDNDNSPATSRNVVTRTTSRTSRTSSRTGCPTNQASMVFAAESYCCPGSFYGLGANALCGVACSGGPTTVTASLPSGRTCASTIMITDNSYSSKVAAATSRAGTTATSPGAAAMITSGPWMGALVVAGGVLLAV